MPVVTQPRRQLASYPVPSFFYRLFYTIGMVARAPFWALQYGLFPRTRPYHTWTFKQAFLMKVFTEVVYMDSRTEKPRPLSLEPGNEGDSWVTLEPFPSTMYLGPLEDKNVQPAVIGSTWFPSKPTEFSGLGKDKAIVFHIHGGGFVLGDGRKAETQFLANLYLTHGNAAAVFSPQYRLASRPTSAPFPAPLQDTLTSYLYLVRTLGIPPEKIVLSGDSAGANLAIGLLRYITSHPSLEIPLPNSAVLVSPWVAPVKHLWPEIAIKSNPYFATDYLGVDFCRYCAGVYTGPASSGVAPDDAYITPLGHPFAVPGVPILVTVGALEMLSIDGDAWAKEMAHVQGNQVETYFEPEAPHDTLLLGYVCGFKDSAAEVAKRIGEFIKRQITE
ncbi:alpha/beta hydrolase fold-3 domain-containing protein [Xylariaceae sp. FL0594]|nr:alpha/beta hydrolase fold-3 domain-containing protein [Xylariaceae sp. FL0594]